MNKGLGSGGKRQQQLGMGGGAGDPMAPFGGPDDVMALSPDPVDVLAEWVETTMARTRVVRFQLRSKTVDGESPIQEWEVAEDFANSDAAGIAGVIFSRAEEDADGAGTAHSKFVVLAYKAGKDTYFARTFFRIMPQDQDNVMDSEPATAGGLLAQAHRHLESVMRLHIGGSADVLRTLRRENERMAASNEVYAEQHIKLLQLQQQLLDKGAIRNLMVQKETFKIGLKHRVVSDAMNIGMNWVGQHFPELVPAASTALAVAGGGGGSAKGKGAAQSSGEIELNEDEGNKLSALCMFLIGEMAKLPDTAFKLLLTQIDKESRDPIAQARNTIKKVFQEGRKELEESEGEIVFATRVHLVQILATIDDQKFEALLSKIDANGHKPLRVYRTLIRERLAKSEKAETKTKSNVHEGVIEDPPPKAPKNGKKKR